MSSRLGDAEDAALLTRDKDAARIFRIYVRLAAGGENVLITDRDRVVAEIVPPQPGRSPLLADARLAEAIREGWLAPHCSLAVVHRRVSQS